MGLPSGTLWLDRPLGANKVGGQGLIYQWGALIGYRNASIMPFSDEVYRQAGLYNITSSLTVENDAAAAYYGEIARIPTAEQIEELIQFSTVSKSGNVYRIHSNVNGNDLYIYGRGYYINVDHVDISSLYLWSRSYYSQVRAKCLTTTSGAYQIQNEIRFHGTIILPVKSA